MRNMKKYKKPDQFKHYTKLLRVIVSCTTFFHIIYVHKMIKQYQISFGLRYDDITLFTLRVLIDIKQDELYKKEKII